MVVKTSLPSVARAHARRAYPARVPGFLRAGGFDDQFYVKEIDALERVRRAFDCSSACGVRIGTRAREDRIFAL